MEINKIYNENCLETMAKMPDNFIDLTVTSPPYDDLRTNEELSNIFNENLRALGIDDIKPAEHSSASSDIGNVSHVAPTIHPYIAITDCPIPSHTTRMAETTTTTKAHEILLTAALAMAYTGYDVIVRKESLRK